MTFAEWWYSSANLTHGDVSIIAFALFMIMFMFIEWANK